MTRNSRRQTLYERRFWMGQFYAGLAGYLGVSLIVLCYVSLTPSSPNRIAIALLSILAIAYAYIFYLSRHHIVASRYRLPVFMTSSVIAFFLLTAMCALDGGVGSPITYLLITAMSYLALGYPLFAVFICGAIGLASYTILASITARSFPNFVLMMQFVALGDIWVLAMIGAAFRDRKDRELDCLRAELEKGATIDSLTGCLNHRAFTEALERATARALRKKRTLSLILIDIDHFKNVNDQHGHMNGDTVLRQVGHALAAVSRPEDTIGRPGGDEFALLAPEADEAGARSIAERVRSNLTANLDLPVAITLSIGICSMIPESSEGNLVFKRADEALYRAKNNGRNQIAA